MMDGNEEKRSYWLLHAQVVDRAGALTSMASAFSSEAINIETVIGHGGARDEDAAGTVLVTFLASEEEKDKMVRKVKRLPKVLRLVEYPFVQDGARESLILLAARGSAPSDDPSVAETVNQELVKSTPGQFTYLLATAPRVTEGAESPADSPAAAARWVSQVLGGGGQ